MPFRLNCSQVHLTYRTHIPFEQLKLFLGSKGPIKALSIVHEEPHEHNEHDNDNIGEPRDSTRVSRPSRGPQLSAASPAAQETESEIGAYQHTHCYIHYGRKLDTIDPRFFDFADIHCHIRVVKTMQHASYIWHTYHTKEGGNLLQEGQPPPEPRQGGHTELKRIKQAPSLFDACALLGITPQTVTDVAAIRNEKIRPLPAGHTHPDANWTLTAFPNWKALYLYGPTGTGKTSWAVHQFERGLLISDADDLRFFDPDIYDGIIFDDCAFARWTPEMFIHLLDWEFDRDIHCRYHNARIPRNTRKIICSNLTWYELFKISNQEQEAAVKRRFSQVIHVVGPTFLGTRPHLTELDAIENEAEWLEEPPAITEPLLSEEINEESMDELLNMNFDEIQEMFSNHSNELI